MVNGDVLLSSVSASVTASDTDRDDGRGLSATMKQPPITGADDVSLPGCTVTVILVLFTGAPQLLTSGRL